MSLSPSISRSPESFEQQKGISRLLCLSDCNFQVIFLNPIAFCNFLRNLLNLLFPCNKILKATIGDVFSSYQLLLVVSLFSCTSEFSKQQEHSLPLKPRKFSSKLQKTDKCNNKTIVCLSLYICEFLRITSEFAGVP